MKTIFNPQPIRQKFSALSLGFSMRTWINLLVATTLCIGGTAMAQGNSDGKNANGLFNSSNNGSSNREKEKDKQKKNTKGNLKEVVVPADVLKLVTCKDALSRNLNVPAAGKIIDGVLWDILGKNSSSTIYGANGDGAVYSCPPSSGQQILNIDQKTGVATCVSYQCDEKGLPKPLPGSTTPSKTITFDCKAATDTANQGLSGWIANGTKNNFTAADGSAWEISCPGGGALVINSANPSASKCNASTCQTGNTVITASAATANKVFDCEAAKLAYVNANSLSSSKNESLFNGTNYTSVTCGSTSNYLSLNTSNLSQTSCKNVTCDNKQIKVTNEPTTIRATSCNIADTSTTVDGQTATCPAGSGKVAVVTLSTQTCTTETVGVGDTEYNFLRPWQLQGSWCESRSANQDDWTRDDCYGTFQGQKVYCKRHSDGECKGQINKEGKCLAGWPGSNISISSGYETSAGRPFFFNCSTEKKTCVTDKRVVCQQVNRCNGGTNADAPVYSGTGTSSVTSKTGGLPDGLVDAVIK